MPRRAYARVLRAASAAASGKRIRYPSARAARPCPASDAMHRRERFPPSPLPPPPHPAGVSSPAVSQRKVRFSRNITCLEKIYILWFSIDSQRSGVFGRELAVHSRTKRRQLTPVRRGADGSGLVLSCECDTELVLQ